MRDLINNNKRFINIGNSYINEIICAKFIWTLNPNVIKKVISDNECTL